MAKGHIPGHKGAFGASDKPKNFLGTLKRLIKYIGKYNKAIIVVITVLVIGTILSTMSPKILGQATTELGNDLMQKIVYNQIKPNIEKLPDEVKSMLPENATVQTLIDMDLVPQDIIDKIPDVANSTCNICNFSCIFIYSD